MATRYRYDFIRSNNNYDPDKASVQAGLITPEPTLAQQQFKDEVDINTLLRRFHLTGELPQGARAPTYADFGEVYDFHSAANAIAQANEAFEQLPAEIRYDKFRNDPARFVAFCSNDENRDELRKLGFLRTDLPPEPASGEATGSSAPPPSGGGSQNAPDAPSGDSGAK